MVDATAATVVCNTVGAAAVYNYHTKRRERRTEEEARVMFTNGPGK